MVDLREAEVAMAGCRGTREEKGARRYLDDLIRLTGRIAEVGQQSVAARKC